ncbi:hypothetical protein [Nocardioides sp.]|uniref:hypothetical protein n=1 Tax=Nocardioides sp. TaxID=35761 RepID=UPI0035197CC1
MDAAAYRDTASKEYPTPGVNPGTVQDSASPSVTVTVHEPSPGEAVTVYFSGLRPRVGAVTVTVASATPATADTAAGANSVRIRMTWAGEFRRATDAMTDAVVGSTENGNWTPPIGLARAGPGTTRSGAAWVIRRAMSGSPGSSSIMPPPLGVAE